jgi:serine/threonine-protein kinase
MPPEQILMKEIDAGVDIFALGVILFEMLAGEPPIVATTPYEYVQLNVTAKPRRLDKVVGGMPSDLVELLDRMLAKERTRRPTSMGEVFSALSSVAAGAGWLDADATPSPPSPRAVDSIQSTGRTFAPRRARRRHVVVAAGLALAATALAVMLWRTSTGGDSKMPPPTKPTTPVTVTTSPSVAPPPPSAPAPEPRVPPAAPPPAPVAVKAPAPTRKTTTTHTPPRPKFDPYVERLAPP